MNALRPYLYWIIMAGLCGLVVVVALLLDPRLEGRSVEELTSRLNARFQAVSELARKAENEIETYQTHDPERFDQLREEYLITRSWEAGLARLQSTYEQQVADSRQDLLDRSAVFAEPISDTRERGDWYFAYQDATGEWLRSLYEDGLLALRGAAAAQAAQGQGLVREDYARSELREPFGLATFGQEFPVERQWPQLTERFRVLQQIGRAVGQTRATAKPNPAMAGLVPEPVEADVRLVSVNWGSGGARTGSGGDATVSIPGGEAIECRVVVRGSPTTILALMAVLDATVEPMVVLRGVTWRPVAVAGSEDERVVDTAYEVDLQLAFLRFTEAGLAALGATREGD